MVALPAFRTEQIDDIFALSSARRTIEDVIPPPGSRAIELDALITDIAAGDREAFERFYDETSRYVYGVLLRILEDRERATDAAQEVYSQVWRTAEDFDPSRGTALSWLAMMARSRAVDRSRSEGSYEDALSSLEDAAGGDLRRHVGERSSNDPEEHTVLRERRELVRSAMAELPEEQAAALRLAYFGGLSQREIAERTDTPLGTVKSRIRMGMGKLEERLAPVLGKDESDPAGGRI